MKLFSKCSTTVLTILLSTTLFHSLALADSLDDVKSKGKMVVAVDPTFPPFEYTDASGRIVGYTPAIMDAVAKKLGVTIEYQKIAFNGIIPGLLAKSFDMESSSLNVTADRAKRVKFTVPFAKSVNAVMTRVDDTRISTPATIETLAGLTGIVKAASAPEKQLKEFNTTLTAKGLPPITILSLDTVEQTVAALNAKRGDFLFDDITVLGGAMQQNQGKLHIAGELGASQWMAWATRPEDGRLNSAISDVILSMQKSGELASLQKTHLGVITVVPAADFIPKQ